MFNYQLTYFAEVTIDQVTIQNKKGTPIKLKGALYFLATFFLMPP